MTNKIKKLNHINIKFQTKRIDDAYRLIHPFFKDKYYEIFFKEMIEEGSDFRLSIQDKAQLEELYNVLETLEIQEIQYELSYYEKTWDDEDFAYYYPRTTYHLDDLKEFEILYKNPKDSGFDFEINDFTLSPDGKYLVTATERNMFVWSMESYTFLSHQIAWDGTAEKIYFSSDSNYHITLINDMGSWQNTIQVWKPLDDSVAQWEWIEHDDFDLEYTNENLRKLSPSLEYLFSSLEKSCYGGGKKYYSEFYSFDFAYKISYKQDTLSLFSMKKNSEIESIYLGSKLKALTFSYDSKYIALGQEEDIEIFSMDNLKQIKILESHSKPIVSLATSRDNRYLLSASIDGVLKLWSLESFELLETIESNISSKITAIYFSVDTTKIIISSKEGIEIWDIENQKPLYHLFNDERFWCRLDGEGRLLEKGVFA